MPGEMVIYGLMGFTHGWGRLLTVMSPAGLSGLVALVTANDDVTLNRQDGRLIQYVEKRKGGLKRLIATNDIQVLTKPEWDAKKAELGEAIWR